MKPKRKRRKTMQERINEQVARNQARVADVLAKEARERIQYLAPCKNCGTLPQSR